MRKLPSDAVDQKGKLGQQKAIGTVMAGVFAAGHAGKDAVPVPQFVGGLNYWRLMRGRGYNHAVTAHVTQNALTFAKSALSRVAKRR